MTDNTATVDIDDYLYDMDEDEYDEYDDSQVYYMRYTNFVSSLTIILIITNVLIILNFLITFVILTNSNLQTDKYSYISALLDYQ